MNNLKICKFLKCCVIKKNGNKSIIASYLRIKKHNLYKKNIKLNIKIKIHDEYNISNIGDIILVRYFRPISKTKSWILYKKINS
ncbi:30S ribosomal protein S17 [endosymbiont of Euscepes postfasciatus]|uniref:small ribosomal subunit protein uS17 n=1 Tax=endosymbiont of Euscepes postfasciatus TaxID=650377 RepID=UPI000DC6F4B6|nr:30S ribosomal protein S17 [endosymbiont of Euscepes postfasciatus]BBA84684.1 30S ribosomal protein S17 [endosymbiont of Euscepes postfasciatus]